MKEPESEEIPTTTNDVNDEEINLDELLKETETEAESEVTSTIPPQEQSEDVDMEDSESKDEPKEEVTIESNGAQDVPVIESKPFVQANTVEVKEVKPVPAPPPAPPAPVEEDDEEDDEEEGIPEELDEEDESGKQSRFVRQTHVIIVPSYASWFNMKKIHQIEKESLPEFFNSNHPSKSSKIYANYRNFMVNSYRLNPNEFLTLTSCRRNLVGDVGTIMRVHRFLCKWGLINYQVRPQFKPGYAVEKLPNGQSVGLPYTGDYHVKYDTPRGLFPFDTFKVAPERADISKLKELVFSSDAGITQDINQKKHGLSTDEQGEGQGQTGDEPPTKKQNDGWSSEEVKSLINGISKFKNDWYKISELVGPKKTVEQCIFKFLKLPIQDKFNPIDDKDGLSIKLLKFANNNPLSSHENPVLSNLVFMTKLVDSEVAKAASEAASKIVDEKIIEKVKQVYETNVVPNSESSATLDQSSSEVKSLDQNGNIEHKEGEDVTKESTGKEKEVAVDTTEVEANKSSSEVLKDAAAATFGIVGGRSHLFASYEEREMQKLSNTIINQELSKIDLKLSKVEELEKIYERERRQLAKQQQDIFVDRLALAKSTISIAKKLDTVINLLSSDSGSSDNDKVSSLLAEAKSLLFKPAKNSLVPTTDAATNGNGEADNSKLSIVDSTAATSNLISSSAGMSNINEDDYKPLSLNTPKTFKVWVP
ncbi:hypothetical protein DFJ63DRAFT_317351 [Scheffersomyces coipomensis]|uniref:uncharacterized protein n=1 Tax=Scheffersomyces coipomensis TaxID=1788519 RepID=UPI00315D6D12